MRERQTIEKLIADHGLDNKKFHQWLSSKGWTYIEDIPVNEYRAVIRQINKSIEAHRDNS